MMADKNDTFFTELVQYHISGQLKVAPEHMSDNALYYMGKPSFSVYEKFKQRYERINQKLGKKQYLVPYLMSSHPGATLDDSIHLAEYLHSIGYMPQQVQDFYPTPGTLSTAMYYSEIDPRTMKPVYVAKSREEKAQQRALLQWRKPENRPIIVKALRQAGREDLIGFGPDCLIRPARGEKTGTRTDNTGRRGANTKTKSAKQGTSRRGAKSEPSRPLKRKAGWAKPKKKKQ